METPYDKLTDGSLKNGSTIFAPKEIYEQLKHINKMDTKEEKYTISTIFGHQKRTNWYVKAVCIKFLFDCFYSGVAVIKKNY